MSQPTLDEVMKLAWWQRWEIAPGVFTPGPHDVHGMLTHLDLPASMQGLRVLDIGGWNGAVSFECERRGATEVVMIEPTPTAATGFEVTKAYLGSAVRCHPGTIYDLDPRWLGHFDVVLCLGVIYHLRYPLLGLDNIRRVCRQDLYVESAILDSAAWTPTGVRPLSDFAPSSTELPTLQFFDQRQYFNDGTSWFVPNAVAANAMIRAAGFEVLRHHVAGRYYCRARVAEGKPPILEYAHEGIDYETHARRLLGALSDWPGMW